MKKGLLIFTLLISNFIYCQNNYVDIITQTAKNHDQRELDSLAKTIGYKGGESVKVYVLFKVNEKGEIFDIRARGPHKIFEEEGIKLVKEIPKLDPPKNFEKGKSMSFALPLKMVIETDSEKKKRIKKEQRAKEKKKNN